MQHLHPHVASIFCPDFSWDVAVVVTMSDARNYQEQGQIDGVTQNFNSQQACITALAPGKALNSGKMLIHPVELEFDENQKSLSPYTDGRGLRTVQCC